MSSHLSKKSLYYLYFIILFLMPIFVHSQTTAPYSFIVAGHAYGAHEGTNIGLHPNLLEALNSGFDPTVGFFVFTGDIVNLSTQESWNQVESELESYSKPYYYVMGNHDANDVGYAVFEKKYGGSYYSFPNQSELYIVLNSIESDRSISSKQLEFLKNALNIAGGTVKNVFIFFHEVIWNSNEKYKGVKSNSRSRYDQMIDNSNYWSEVHPLLLEYADKEFYLIAGDVGGNTDAISAFYDKWDNVTLLASGMGEVVNENYLLASISEKGEVSFELVPLSSQVTMNRIEFYSVPAKPSEIYGQTIVVAGSLGNEYFVDNVFNAESFIWELPENATGVSYTNIINVDFNTNFKNGELNVKAYSEGYGSSSPTSLNLKTGINSIIKVKRTDEFIVNAHIKDHICNLHLTTVSPVNITISAFNFQGSPIYSEKVVVLNEVEKFIDVNKVKTGIVIINIEGNNRRIVKKILVR